MRVFLSYRFNKRDAWIPEQVGALIRAMGHNVVTGSNMAGAALTEEIKARIASCQWLIAFVTQPDPVDGGETLPRWIVEELLTAHVGGKRTLEVREAGVTEQSGFNGPFVYLSFSYDDRASLLVAVANALAQWRDKEFEDIPHRSLGFHKTLHTIEKTVLRTKQRLFEPQDHQDAIPFRFDISDECINTYVEALEHTKDRFWVTAFFTSGFWQNPPAAAVEANQNICRRLSHKASLKRLFLLTEPIASELERRQDEYLANKKAGLFDDAARQERELAALSERIAGQERGGFEIRITHDAGKMWRELNLPEFDPSDSEIAIFDQNRLDVYSGGKSGRTQTAHCYTSLVANFQGFLSPAERYFDGLWQTAVPVSRFLVDLDRKLREAQRKIDYDPIWLAEYELDLKDEVDLALKTVEMGRVEEILRTRELYGKVKSMLDIGTCTGRYPIALVSALGPGGKIQGLDSDNDCVRFANALVRKKCLGDIIDITRGDFTSNNIQAIGSQFEVVLCMLGTLSHFGMDRKDDHDDELQQCLGRMRDLLTPDGVLIIGQWSDWAITQTPPKLLGIYGERDAKRLALWTCFGMELRQRLTQARLQIRESLEPHQRLDLYVCGRQS